MKAGESRGDAYWSLLEPIWEDISIYDRPEKFEKDFNAISVAARTLYAVHLCQSEVCNGGLHQFFFNSTGILAPEAAVAFRSIGMPQLAAIVEHGMNWFGESYPRECQNRKERLAHAGSDKQFYALDEEFFGLWDSENGGFLKAAYTYALTQHG